MAHPVQSFRKCVVSRKIKMRKLFQMGPIICKMIRVFQIWPRNSNRITFDPLFLQKKTVKSRDFFFSKITIKSLDLTVFLAKRGSNVIRFEFYGQIWNPRIILHII